MKRESVPPAVPAKNYLLKQLQREDLSVENVAYPNRTVKKIPKQVLSRCEWGHDYYSPQVENLPQKPPEPGQQALDLE